MLQKANYLGSVRARRVEHTEHTEQFPVFTFFLDCDTQTSEATRSKLLRLGSVGGDGVRVELGEFQDGVGSTLGTSVVLALLLNLSGDSLGDRVEWSELVSLPSAFEHLLSLGVILQPDDGDLVNRVKTKDVVRRSKNSNSHEPVRVDIGRDVWFIQGKLVGSKSASFIRAKYVDTSQRLNSGKLLNDSLAFGEVGSTNGESSSRNNRKTNRHTNDKED